jgi:hypothetical protein
MTTRRPHRSAQSIFLFVSFCLALACGGKVLATSDQAADPDAGPPPTEGTGSSGGFVGGGSSGGNGSSGSVGGSSGGGGNSGGGSGSGSGSGSGGPPIVDAGADARPRDASLPDSAIDSGVGSNCGTGTAGSACTPEPLGSCVPSDVPLVSGKGSCTAADVATFYNDCVSGGQDCSGTGLSSQACYRCLWSESTSSPWGTLVVYYQPEPTYAFWLNLAACYGAIGASTACTAAVEEQMECENAACTGSCYLTADAGAWGTCIVAADQAECATYVNAAAASCPASIVDAGACSAPDDDGGIEAYYFAVAKTVCE